MKHMKDELHLGNEREAGRVDRFLMRLTEKSCSKCILFSFYETAVPIEIIKESITKK